MNSSRLESHLFIGVHYIVCTVYLHSTVALAFMLFIPRFYYHSDIFSNCFIIDYCQLFMTCALFLYWKCILGILILFISNP
jgi:hypothetical protein